MGHPSCVSRRASGEPVRGAVLALAAVAALAMANSCEAPIACPPAGSAGSLTIAVAVAQSQLEGWSTEARRPDDWSHRTCGYRASDDAWVRLVGSYVHVPPADRIWAFFAGETREGPWAEFARRVVRERQESLLLLAGAVSNTRLVWGFQGGPPRWRPDEVHWQNRFESQLLESGWAPDLTVFHLGESDANEAQIQGLSVEETYAGMYAGMLDAIDQAAALTGAPVMVVPVGLGLCRFSWPACTTQPNAWVQAVHDAQVDAALDHPAGCLGPLVDDLRYEPVEPFADEVHFHEVRELGSRIYDALPGCGL